MARISVGATAGIGGPQGAGSTPPPTQGGQTAASGGAVQRAKIITAGLFVLLVVLHTKGSKS